jgi:6,7-dimethyl-8-ribityllumazine synthase
MHAAPASGDFSHRDVAVQHVAGSGRGGRWAIVVARFNGSITEQLYRGAVDTFLEAGAQPDRIHAFAVPGAVELPLAVHEVAETSHYAGIVALGCVIRGETAHFDYVCSSATDGLLQVQLNKEVPVGFGVLTCENEAQARARAQSNGRNAGADAAAAVLEQAALLRVVRSI